MTDRGRYTAVTALFAAAAASLFVPLFVTRGAGILDFWWWMSGALFTLCGAGFFADPEFAVHCAGDLRSGAARKILYGAGSALFIYLAFFAGNWLSRMIFDFAERGIQGVYGFRNGASTLRITLLLALVIGPGEELFWRAFLQRRLEKSLGANAGFAVAVLLYAAVHLAGGNAMLVLAALVCGVFWGFLYRRYRSPLLNVVSHTLWDIAAFVVFPFTS